MQSSVSLIIGGIKRFDLPGLRDLIGWDYFPPFLYSVLVICKYYGSKGKR